MNNKLISTIVVGVIVLVGFGAVIMMDKDNDKMSDNMDMATTEQDSSMSPDKMSSGMQETNMVTFKGFTVVQKAIKVKKGTTVTWTNEDNAKHDVTPDTETAEFKATELFGKGESKSITFNTVGKFSYFCSPHPYMKGTIEVVE